MSLLNPVHFEMNGNKEVIIEGLLSIQAGENPRVIEEKLKSFLAPKDREAEGDDAGGDE